MSPSAQIPSVGAQVGRYQFLREVATGVFGTLYELRAADEGASLNGLGRVVAIAPELSPEVAQAVSEAAWDSLELQHPFTLTVADVVFEKEWFTLIHDFSEGSVLRSLQRRCSERATAFPVDVAARVMVDVLDGLEKTKTACNSAGIRWRPGSTHASSLYLCGDGRTRALDGQLNAALLRMPETRAFAQGAVFPAPELLEQTKEQNDRTDVFAAAVVFFELLTGQEYRLDLSSIAEGTPWPKVPDLSRAIPKDLKPVPLRIKQLLSAALSYAPSARPASVVEFRDAVVNSVEVANYAQVIDFTDALLTRESTLFRLDLAPAPKLSETQTNERPVDRKPDWLTELAKRAQAPKAQAPHSSATAEPRRQLNPPPKPASVSTQLGPAGERFASQPSIVEQVKTQLSDEAPSRPQSSQPSTPRFGGVDALRGQFTPTQLSARPSMQTLMGIRPEDIQPTKAPTQPAQDEAKVERPLAKQTFVGVGPTQDLSAAPSPAPMNTVTALLPQTASNEPHNSNAGAFDLGKTHHGPFSPPIAAADRTLKLEPLVAQTLAVMTETEAVVAREPAASPTPLVELVPAQKPSAPVVAAPIPENKRRVLQLSLPSLLIGAAALVGLAVFITLFAQRHFAKPAVPTTLATFGQAPTASIEQPRATALPVSVAPVAASADVPLASASVTVEVIPSTAPTEAVPTQATSRPVLPASPAETKPSTKPTAIPPKRVTRKPARKYVPAGL